MLGKVLRQAKRAFWMPQNRPYLVTQCAGIPKGLEGKAKTAGSQGALKMVGESQNSILGALKCVFGSV